LTIEDVITIRKKNVVVLDKKVLDWGRSGAGDIGFKILIKYYFII
jgi:hypothetical protein